jgi:hypothetical protein
MLSRIAVRAVTRIKKENREAFYQMRWAIAARGAILIS